MSLFLSLLGPFQLQKQFIFIPVLISFILIEYSLNIFHFSEFFKNPVFRFHSTLVV